MYRMPRDSSAVMYQPPAFTPDRSFHPSLNQVLLAGWPGCGTDGNSQSFLPVRASNARVLPDGPVSCPPVVAPTAITFLIIVGTPVYGTTMSTVPWLPKPGSILPVAAASAIRLRPDVKKIRAELCLSPDK